MNGLNHNGSFGSPQGQRRKRPSVLRFLEMAPSAPRRRADAKAESTAPKREAIVDAAARLFARYGFRRTSMDLLAAEAQVAKPTLYAYFDDKDAVFRAVVDHVMTQVVSGARAAAARKGSIADRLAGALAAKFTFLHELVHTSPHAAELLDSQGALGADLVERHDRDVRRVLAGLVEEGVAAGELDLADLSSASLVEILLRAGHGAGWGAPTTAAHKRHLTELVRLIVGGLEPRRR